MQSFTPSSLETSNRSILPLNEKGEKLYEVVFFAHYSNRPTVEEITAYFNQYGVVHHVDCPQTKQCAFIFMSTLSSNEQRNRTKNTLIQIRQQMDPTNPFNVSVASYPRNNAVYPTSRSLRSRCTQCSQILPPSVTKINL